MTIDFKKLAAKLATPWWGPMAPTEYVLKPAGVGVGKIVKQNYGAFLSGVVNAPYRYWLALAFLVVCVLVVWWLSTARTGHAWAAVRENEDRVEVLGMSAYRTKLTAVVVAGFLVAPLL